MNKMEIKGLSKSYGEKKALVDFDMSLSQGEIVGFIGQNGAGKTTLLNSIAGNIIPSSGKITYNSKNLALFPDIRKKIGVLIEPSFLDYMNCHDNLKLLMLATGAREKKDMERKIDEVLETVGLADCKNKYVKHFSFGMKQRLGFAQTLLEKKELLFLDEPFVGLDINGRAMMKEYIRRLVAKDGISVLFSDHNLDEVNDLCHRVVAIENGIKIYDGHVIDDIEYEIIVESIDEILLERFCQIPEIEISTEGLKLTLRENKDLNAVLSEIMSFTRIESIRTKENALERLLKEGVS